MPNFNSPDDMNFSTIWEKIPSEFEPWAKPTLKGKPLLINDTFVRVDDVPSYSIYSRYGDRYSMHVATSAGSKTLMQNACEGHVLSPDWAINGSEFAFTHGTTLWLRSRCMTAAELEEARADHIYARTFNIPWAIAKDCQAEYQNIPGKEKEHGPLDGDLRLRAFNLALHRKRQEIAAKMAQRGLKWDYNKFFTHTYDDAKMTEMFRKQVPPPPAELKTGRENTA